MERKNVELIKKIKSMEKQMENNVVTYNNSGTINVNNNIINQISIIIIYYKKIILLNKFYINYLELTSLNE